MHHNASNRARHAFLAGPSKIVATNAGKRPDRFTLPPLQSSLRCTIPTGPVSPFAHRELLLRIQLPWWPNDHKDRVPQAAHDAHPGHGDLSLYDDALRGGARLRIAR